MWSVNIVVVRTFDASHSKMKIANYLPMAKPEAISSLKIQHDLVKPQSNTDCGQSSPKFAIWVSWRLGETNWNVWDRGTRCFRWRPEWRFHNLARWIIKSVLTKTTKCNETPGQWWSLIGSNIGQHSLESVRTNSYLVDPASSHMLVSKIKPCMSKYKQICTVKLRMAH